MSNISRLLLVLACTLWVAPAWAQDEDESPSTEEAASESSDETSDDEEATPEEASTEEAPAPEDEADDEEVDEEEATAEDEEIDALIETEGQETPDVPGAARDPGEAPSEEKLEERSQEDTATKSAAALGAGSAMVSQDEAAKPWTLSGSASLNLGASVLSGRIDDSLVTFDVSAFGLYKLANLWEGRVDGYAAFSFNQVLDNAVSGGPQGGVSERPFIFNDVVIGALGRSLFVEDNTGLIFGYNTLFRLPTSPLARASDRKLRWDNSVNMTKAISNAGPGTVVLSLSETFRYDFAPRNPTFDAGERESLIQNACATQNQRANGECASSVPGFDFGLITTLSARYLMNFGLNFSVRSSLFYIFQHRLEQSVCNEADLVAGVPCADVIDANSPNATDQRNVTALWFSSVSLGYVITPNLNAGLGFSTIAPVVQQSGDNSRAPGNPFFNFAEDNSTSFFVSMTGTY